MSQIATKTDVAQISFSGIPPMLPAQATTYAGGRTGLPVAGPSHSTLSISGAPAGPSSVYRQQVAWLEREARWEEQQANQLVYQVGKGWARELAHHPLECWRRKKCSQVEVAAVAVEEEARQAEVVAAEETAAAAEARQARQPRHQADKRWRKEPQLRVHFQLPTER